MRESRHLVVMRGECVERGSRNEMRSRCRGIEVEVEVLCSLVKGKHSVDDLPRIDVRQ